MPKGKLKIKSADLGNLKTAAELNDVVLGEGKNFGEHSVVEFSFKTPQQVFDLGRTVDTINLKPVKEV